MRTYLLILFGILLTGIVAMDQYAPPVAQTSYQEVSYTVRRAGPPLARGQWVLFGPERGAWHEAFVYCNRPVMRGETIQIDRAMRWWRDTKYLARCFAAPGPSGS